MKGKIASTHTVCLFLVSLLLLSPSWALGEGLVGYPIAPGPGKPTCNDGTDYIYYVNRPQNKTANWVIFMEGGAWCFDGPSCDERYEKQNELMSSSNYPSSWSYDQGILSEDPSTNPLFFNWNLVFLPYCTSDDFSGNATKPETGTNWSFLGSRIVPTVVTLLKSDHGLVDRGDTTVLLSGSSAGAEAIFTNLDTLDNNLLPYSRVVSLCDSGWFLDSTPYHRNNCTNSDSCTEQYGLERGTALWQAVMDEDCQRAMATTPDELWKCLLGPTAANYLSAPMMIFNYLFDQAEFGHDGLGFPRTPAELEYAQENAVNVTKTLRATQQQWVFAPSCFEHTIIFYGFPQFATISVNGVTLTEAMQRFLRGESFWLVDRCRVPQCNPTCPPPAPDPPFQKRSLP
eukprot:TRINITY_DN2336_c0_g2_i1.p1 TRINITY_DN2336_c0_g2~~TRINITY_DN2336_c0_g2_i1.p1  ORF type:complete len:400 (+),score=72.96 TRINITY_DN2336_c0_g2_i1:1-1200(+)